MQTGKSINLVSACFFFMENVVYYYTHVRTVSTRPLFREEWPGDDASIFTIGSEENSMNVIKYLGYFLKESEESF